VRCLEHLPSGGQALNLTLGGEVLRTGGAWKTHSRARVAAIETLKRDLRAAPGAFGEAWTVDGLERYVAEWIGWEAAVDVRPRLAHVADALGQMVSVLPEAEGRTLHRLRARPL
jgi:hypothetical protein